MEGLCSYGMRNNASFPFLPLSLFLSRSLALFIIEIRRAIRNSIRRPDEKRISYG